MDLPGQWIAERSLGRLNVHHLVHEPCGFRSPAPFDLTEDQGNARRLIAAHVCEPQQQADERPDWATGRGRCPICELWIPVTTKNKLRKHKRVQRGRFHMVDCSGSGAEAEPKA